MANTNKSESPFSGPIFVHPRPPIQLKPGMLYLRGSIALLFAALCLFTPGPSIQTFVRLAGLYFIVDGFCALLLQQKREWRQFNYSWTMLTGIAGVGVGLWTFLNTAPTAVTIDELVGVWAIFIGVLEIAGAFEMRRDGSIRDNARYAVALIGTVSAAIGVLMIAQSWIAWMTLVTLLAANALVTAVACFVLGREVDLRRREKRSAPEEFRKAG